MKVVMLVAINGRISAVGKRVSGNVGVNGNVNGGVDKADNIYIKEVTFNNRYEFPSFGKENMIYVATDEHKSYIFNPTTLNYEVIGADYSEIEIIQGTL